MAAALAARLEPSHKGRDDRITTFVSSLSNVSRVEIAWRPFTGLLAFGMVGIGIAPLNTQNPPTKQGIRVVGDTGIEPVASAV